MRRHIPLRTILATLAIAAGAVLLWQFAGILLMVFAAILFAILLNSGAGFVRSHVNLSQGGAVAVVVVALIIVVGVAIWVAAPGVVEQAGALSDSLPKAVQAGIAQLETKAWGKELVRRAGTWREWTGSESQLVSRATTLFGGVAGGIAALLVTFFVGLYLALEPATYRKGFVRLFPPERRGTIDAVLCEIGEKLKWWLLGRLLMMTFVAVFTWIGLAVLGIPLAFTLAVLAGLLDFVQNIGPWLAVIPPLLLAVPYGPVTVLWVAILYTVVQLTENYVLGPVIQRRTADIPPALLIPGQIAFGVLLGAGGLVLAAPIIAAVLVAVRRLYIEQALEGATD